MASGQKRPLDCGDLPDFKRQHSEQTSEILDPNEYWKKGLADFVLQTEVDLRATSGHEQFEKITQMACALRNSGGGVIQMRLTSRGCGKGHQVGFDKFNKALDSKLEKMLSENEKFADVFMFHPKPNADYFNKPQNERVIQLFVKSASFLCFISYGTKDSQEHGVESKRVQSVYVKQLLVDREKRRHAHSQRPSFPPDPCSPLPKYFILNEDYTALGECSYFQLKDFSTSGNIPRQIIDAVAEKYFAPFANVEGGFCLIGMKEVKKGVPRCIGTPLKEGDQQLIRQKLEEFLEEDLKCCPVLNPVPGRHRSAKVLEWMVLKIGEHVTLDFVPVITAEGAEVRFLLIAIIHVYLLSQDKRMACTRECAVMY